MGQLGTLEGKGHAPVVTNAKWYDDTDHTDRKYRLGRKGEHCDVVTDCEKDLFCYKPDLFDGVEPNSAEQPKLHTCQEKKSESERCWSGGDCKDGLVCLMKTHVIGLGGDDNECMKKDANRVNTLYHDFDDNSYERTRADMVTVLKAFGETVDDSTSEKVIKDKYNKVTDNLHPYFSNYEQYKDQYVEKNIYFTASNKENQANLEFNRAQHEEKEARDMWSNAESARRDLIIRFYGEDPNAKGKVKEDNGKGKEVEKEVDKTYDDYFFNKETLEVKGLTQNIKEINDELKIQKKKPTVWVEGDLKGDLKIAKNSLNKALVKQEEVRDNLRKIEKQLDARDIVLHNAKIETKRAETEKQWAEEYLKEEEERLNTLREKRENKNTKRDHHLQMWQWRSAGKLKDAVNVVKALLDNETSQPNSVKKVNELRA